MKAPRAGKSTMIRGSDGLDYADLAARLKNEPLNTPRVRRIRDLRQKPNDPRAAGLFVYAYDLEYHALVQGHGHETSHNTAMLAGNGAAQRLHRLVDLDAEGDLLAIAMDPVLFAATVKAAKAKRVAQAREEAA